MNYVVDVVGKNKYAHTKMRDTDYRIMSYDSGR